MFDVSFVELMVIAVVALLVLGPERLPAAVRTVGGFVRKARASWNSVRTEFERELSADEFRRSMRKTAQDIRSAVEGETVAPPSPAERVAPTPPPREAARAPHD